MAISDQDLRDLVRESVARHLRVETPVESPLESRREPGVLLRAVAFDARHASHRRLPVTPGSEADGLCIIEPAVRCHHCGYCQSYGH